MTSPTLVKRIGSAEAAPYIGVTLRELKRLRQARRIPFYRVSHRTCVYAESELDDFLNRCRVPVEAGAA